MSIQPLSISARDWAFLSRPERYVKETEASGRPLALESTRRQFRTAEDILKRLTGKGGEHARSGLLLADDVGLGKTTVAALVAWVVAAGKTRGRVRILAPNDVMVRRWVKELHDHIGPLTSCAVGLDVHKNRVKHGRVDRLGPGSIQVVKHSYASDMESALNCDLLIIDEAHRAKGDESRFRKALKERKNLATRVLILTATPFSIRLEELHGMLSIVGATNIRAQINGYSKALDDLFQGHGSRSPTTVGHRLADRAEKAVVALQPYVIRHSVENLPLERDSFGEREDWPIPVPPASDEELELLVRVDRVLRLARANDDAARRATNDPRFHVGWRHFDREVARIGSQLDHFDDAMRSVVAGHLNQIKMLREKVGPHAKMVAVAKEVSDVVKTGEKVLLFCHHHDTAAELTLALASSITPRLAPRCPPERRWLEAWDAVVPERLGSGVQRTAYLSWLSSESIRRQVWGWISTVGEPSPKDLTAALRSSPARHRDGGVTIHHAAESLFDALLDSTSSKALLKTAVTSPDLLPQTPVLGLCNTDDDRADARLFLGARSTDTAIAIFNSPFGPDVLVAMDKESEGIDLHRWCRHLVHYELDPSPIRTVQRNGRVRRVKSWASIIKEPIRYAYPAFRGTRDHRLVQIMKRRIDTFSLLLGGVQDFDVDEVDQGDEALRAEVIAIAKERLAGLGTKLTASSG